MLKNTFIPLSKSTKEMYLELNKPIIKTESGQFHVENVHNSTITNMPEDTKNTSFYASNVSNSAIGHGAIYINNPPHAADNINETAESEFQCGGCRLI